MTITTIYVLITYDYEGDQVDDCAFTTREEAERFRRRLIDGCNVMKIQRVRDRMEEHMKVVEFTLHERLEEVDLSYLDACT